MATEAILTPLLIQWVHLNDNCHLLFWLAVPGNRALPPEVEWILCGSVENFPCHFMAAAEKQEPFQGLNARRRREDTISWNSQGFCCFCAVHWSPRAKRLQWVTQGTQPCLKLSVAPSGQHLALHFLAGITTKSVAFDALSLMLPSKPSKSHPGHVLTPRPHNTRRFGNKSQMQPTHHFRESKASDRRAGSSSEHPKLLLGVTHRKQFALLTWSQHPAVSAESSGGTRHQMRVLSRNPAKADMQKIKY